MGITFTIDSINTESQEQQIHQQYNKVSPEQIAQHLINGGRIWPRHQLDAKGNPRFEKADFAVVAIDTTYLPVEHILGSDFTQQYAKLAVYQDKGQDTGRCILVFCLPEPVTLARDYVLILEGLKTLYAGALKHHSALHQWGAPNLSNFDVLDGNLTIETVGHLKMLGFESKQLASARGTIFLRSRVTLGLDTPLRVEGLEQPVTLDRIGAGVKVFCPIHVDMHPVAKTYQLEDGSLAVTCPCCERTYTQASAGKKYDFGYFDRVIAELEKVDVTMPRHARIINRSSSAYLPELGLWEGVLCVKSPKGSGKTEQLLNTLREIKENKLSVLLIGHRRSLIKSMCRRLGLTCYFTSEGDIEVLARPIAEIGKGLVDFGDAGLVASTSVVTVAKAYGNTDIVKVLPVSNYGTCMDSMPDLDPQRHPYDVIIIDEAEQVFAHLVGDTVKNRRREIYLKLRHYLRVAKSVVLMDADLGMTTMTALFGMGLKSDTSIRFWINAPKTKAGVVKMYGTKAQLMARIRLAVDNGEKCYIATNSKAKAEEISASLSLLSEGLRIECIHSGNSSSAKVQGLLRNIAHEFEHNLDVLIASPALGTGVDITFKTNGGEPRSVVQHTFGLFEGRITTHMDCDQHLMRVRHPSEVHVWIDPTAQNFETDTQILRDQLGNMINSEHALLDYTDEGKPIFAEDDGLIGIWAQVLAASNGSMNQLARLFKQIREDNGWTVEHVEIDPDAIKVGASALKLGREERLSDRVVRIVGAQSFETDPDGALERKRLEAREKKGLPMTDTERARLDRYRIERFYGVEIDSDLVKFDAEGRMRGAIRNLELLMAPWGRLATLSFREYQKDRIAIDMNMLLLKRTLLLKLLNAAGIYRRGAFDSNAIFDHSSLKRFVSQLEKHRGQVELAFGLAMRRDAHRNRVQQFGDVLRLVGLTPKIVSTEESGGKKIRRYSLDEERLGQMISVARERLKPSYKFERDRVQDELHGYSDQWAHEQEGLAIAA